MEKISRRAFLGRSLFAGASAAAILATPGRAVAASAETAVGTFIDLTKCEGCGECVTACRVKNESRYPNPVDDIPANWPSGTFEDWRAEREATDKLTPYNWTYVEKVEVDGVSLSIPRRCMHCDNPPCANLCPFSVMDKTPEGAVTINPDGCMGGAKCRSVCSWNIPQRQAGTGLYMKIAPGLIGGGVMYKCDMCADLIAEGEQPACVSACPNGAVIFGPKEQMRDAAQTRATQIGGHLYGATENGGTSTFYVSPVPFEAIDAAIAERRETLPEKVRSGVPGMKPSAENYLDTVNGMALGYAIAPVAGVAAAAFAAVKAMKGDAE
ncbi:MAG: 4Fe-4S dicluster domain-containing protein [Clostridiales bacterium]|nr:4Fe-4S dicluster domain-containing protein [Clostridiales bacterium]